ncbi:MAG: 16S rRNA (uracil(1498)-N(3))-methyltransferase [Oligoflexia bacterium]|nr:16S rRNA (uracil(1498)-N(3))-methyltransferase [Oligoflexia bacterium]
MKRFYLPEVTKDASRGDIINVPQKMFHRLTNVLKIRKGDEIEFIDGEGLILKTTAQNSGKDFLINERLSVQRAVPETAAACSLLRRERFDLLVEKAVELGVDRIIPFTSRYSRPYAGQSFSRLQERWQRIADQTISQCKRDFRCVIDPVTSLEKLFAYYAKYNAVITFHPESAAMHGSEPAATGSCLFIFGPEGGFSNQEIEYFTSKGIKSYSMSRHLLRAETAVMYALSVMDYTRSNT